LFFYRSSSPPPDETPYKIHFIRVDSKHPAIRPAKQAHIETGPVCASPTHTILLHSGPDSKRKRGKNTRNNPRQPEYTAVTINKMIGHLSPVAGLDGDRCIIG
jgi:hypothetical protein